MLNNSVATETVERRMQNGWAFQILHPAFFIVVLASVLLASAPAAAQSSPPAGRVEVWGGMSVVLPRIDAAFATDYVPVIDRYAPPLAGSTAGQAVALAGSNALGFEVGAAYFFTPHLGAQFFFDRDAFDVSGPAAPYHVALNYAARQPPDYVPRDYSLERTFEPCDAAAAWGCVPPTAGRLRQATLSFNVVGRWGANARVGGELSGGVSYFHVRGDAQPLRYTLFEMGGHSTLFSEEYRLAYSLGPAHGVGINAGGSISISLTRSLALIGDLRYFDGPNLSAPVTVTEVLNQNELAFLQDPATVQQALHPPDVSLNPARFRFLVGVKVRR